MEKEQDQEKEEQQEVEEVRAERHASPRASWDRTLLLVCFSACFDVHSFTYVYACIMYARADFTVQSFHFSVDESLSNASINLPFMILRVRPATLTSRSGMLVKNSFEIIWERRYIPFLIILK